jgi:hypothetical protein
MILELDKLQFEGFGYLKYRDTYKIMSRIISKHNSFYRATERQIYSLYNELKIHGYFVKYSNKKYLFKYVNKNDTKNIDNFIASKKSIKNSDSNIDIPLHIIKFDY